MIKRYPNVEIPSEIIQSFFDEVGTPKASEHENISDVWKMVFKKFDGLNNRDTSNSSVSDICSLYEDYFVNGLSDGACVGKAMESISTRYKYLSREKNRLGSLYLHRNPGVEKSYSRMGSNLKLSNAQYEDIISEMTNLNLSNLVFSGKPWMNFSKGNSYLLELTDHYYFFDIVNRYLSNKIIKPIFIGEGSGILANLFLTSNADVQDSIFIDLQHFLLRQFIINYAERDKIERYIYAQDFNSSMVNKVGFTIINQDSFPEIPKKALNNYFSLIREGKVERVISYNHLDLRGDHVNYREMLKEFFGEPIIRYESIVRNGYFIEIFEN
tara:strand:+ start:506 stop:1486 length:981 start_codon:yes stop_codon:yes gene_type:complete